MRAVLVLCLVVGCQQDKTAVTKTGSAADPWAVTAKADDPPSLVERHKYCEGTGGEELFDEHERKAMHDVGYTDADLDGFENTLVYDRNANWIPRLEELFKDDGVFIAVGAGHLRGPKGVPALLQAQGYTVARVTPPH